MNQERNETIIEFKGITKRYHDFAAVEDFNLEIKKGEFVTFLGPSGCGKTTTLRMIAGFELPTEGSIYLNGKDISELPPNKRPVNTVFQRYALFPHLNIFDNIAFGLKLKVQEGTNVNQEGRQHGRKEKFTRQEIREKVKKVLAVVDLEGFEKRDVSTLSGGQQQRVAIARAIVNEPEILLLDEPLGALDLKMRKEMQLELMAMHEKFGITFIYVTHDQEEALTMSDKIVVMSDGMIQQVGTPEEIYNEPETVFVADFIGESNIFTGKMTGAKKVTFCGTEFICVDELPIGTPVDAVIRPEDVEMTTEQSAMLSGDVLSVIFKGMHYEVTIKSGDNEILMKTIKQVDTGQRLHLSIIPDGIHLIPAQTNYNVYDGVVSENGRVTFADGEFQCNTRDLPSGAKVHVQVPVTAPSMSDDPEAGGTTGNIISLIYKGNHYHYIVRTLNGEDIHLHDKNLWNENDFVSVLIPSDQIHVTPVVEGGTEK
ncbi:MAG: ABC transporter ATP-binding protein [Lachnospiraceae bacterium]